MGYFYEVLFQADAISHRLCTELAGQEPYTSKVGKPVRALC